MHQIIALFGEAEKGALASLIPIQSLVQLNERLGHPPPESQGIHFAIQFLLYQREIIYLRVEEEGYNAHHYFKGAELLSNLQRALPLTAICLPGVGDREILNAIRRVCTLHRACAILTQKDLYDYLTSLCFSN